MNVDSDKLFLLTLRETRSDATILISTSNSTGEKQHVKMGCPVLPIT